MLRAGLVDVADLDRLADLQLAAVERLEADDRLEQRGLADAVRADDADDAVRRQREAEAVDEVAAVEALLEVLGLDDDVAEARSRRDLDLVEVELARLVGLGRHLLVAGETGLRLGLPALGAAAHPLEFVLEALGELLVLLALDVEALGLLLQVGRVVALVADQAAAVDLGDPLGDVVEEVPIVGDGDDGAGVGREVLLEPEHALGVEVVGGLVEQQQVGLGEQQLGERDAALLTTGEVLDARVARRGAQRVHRLLELGVEVPRVGGVDLLLQVAHLGEQGVEVGVGLGHRQRDLVEARELAHDRADALLHVLEHGLALVELGLLHQDADGVAVAQLAPRRWTGCRARP